MKAEFLKIAGVKSEAEFYKKFPSEEAFMKKHGKAIKKLMAKKAKVGDLIPNIQTPKANRLPIRFDSKTLKNLTNERLGKPSVEEQQAEEMRQLQLEQLKTQIEANKKAVEEDDDSGGGIGNMIGDVFSMFGGQGGGKNSGGTTKGSVIVGDLELDGTDTGRGADFGSSKLGAKVKKFEAHMMYDPKTGKGYKANKPADHERMKKLGYLHADEMKKTPKAQVGDNVQEDNFNSLFGNPSRGDLGSGVDGTFETNSSNSADGKKNGLKGLKKFGQDYGGQILSDVFKFKDMFEAQKEQERRLEQQLKITDLSVTAAKSQPEKIEREYVRPEDFANTGEEFFPVYGVGTNVLAKHGGAYKAQNGGMFNDPGYTPLVNVNQVKSFGRGGMLGSNSYLVPKAQGGFDFGNFSYGSDQQSSQLADQVGFNNDAGSQVGGQVGGSIGSLFGPVGKAVGTFLGRGVGDLLDRSDRRQEKMSNDIMQGETELAYSAAGPQIQAGYASHVREGGRIPSNPSMLDTMKMGGELKTLWGGEAETVSYNPYAGGESIQFKGNSHDYRDPKTGQTGIGVAYGKDSVANNEAVVEVENEPAQQLRDGGGAENLVVYGDLKIPKNFVDELGDDRAKNKKFKNYVGDVLNKDEAKINRTMEKASELALDANDNTSIGQLESSTSDVIIKGGDMKLKAIADKKMMLADLQSALNDTFDELEMKGNDFITKGNVVDDPERAMNNMAKSGIEIKPENRGKFTAWAKERNMSVAAAAKMVMANPDKYSKGVVAMANFAINARKFKKAEEGVTVTETTTDGNFNNQLGGDDAGMTVEEAEAANFVLNKDTGEYERPNGETVDPVDASGSSLGYTPKGQSIDSKTGFAGGVTQEEFNKLKEDSSWFDWGSVDLNKTVMYNGKKVSSAILKYQKELNKNLESIGAKPVKVDGILGQETRDAVYKPATPGKKAEVEVANITEEPTTTETTTAAPRGGIRFPNIAREQTDEGPNLLAEKYAMATNQYVPVPAQGLQPELRVPYDISLQDMRNDIISQSRAMERNPAFQNNPAALALTQAPMYSALNKVNAEEFRQNQAMKDAVYSSNVDAINQAKLTNLGIFDNQYDRQQQAISNTRKENINILDSIANKYAQNRLQNMTERVFENMYPSFEFDESGRANTTGRGGDLYIPGYGTASTNGNLSGFNTREGRNFMNILDSAQGLYNMFETGRDKRKRKKEEEANGLTPIESKSGKKIKKNNKNSNILRQFKNL
ncbi:MAG: hypothetical protein CMJ25_26305 [Phycisphaerae bacterium]|nr:hypothetical protein [Phycisphaerae bacterium]|tara:strand:- start:7594 stop:11334 length:3741 start_codon:yes stop_codon:yes gene_type:complete